MKVRGEELPFDGYVFDIERRDLYDKKPWEVFAMHTEYPDQKSVYLFTTSEENNTTTATTTTGGDAWIVENNGTSGPVEDPRYGNEIIGYKKTFFYNNSDQPNVERVMTEFMSLEPPKAPSLDYVVCKLEKIEFPDDYKDTNPMFSVYIELEDTDTESSGSYSCVGH
ncbi:hypothetical protein LguiA_006551 [Lonicera macranthoides]